MEEDSLIQILLVHDSSTILVDGRSFGEFGLQVDDLIHMLDECTLLVDIACQISHCFQCLAQRCKIFVLLAGHFDKFLDE